jgi:hypothetical protein
MLHGVARVHVDAVGAAVDLRDAQIGEVDEGRGETRFRHVAMDTAERAQAFRRGRFIVETLHVGFLQRSGGPSAPTHVGPIVSPSSVNCDAGAPLELRSWSTDCERVTDISAGKSRAAGNQSRLCHDRQFFDRPEAGPFAPADLGRLDREPQSRPACEQRLQGT